MLAYQLYLENKKNNQDTGSGIPIKKLFVNRYDVTIDNTALDAFGDDGQSTVQMSQFLKKQFDMPLDTTPNINLPNKISASRSPKPYVTIPGYIKTKKKKDNVIGELTLGDKTKEYFAKLTIPDYKIEINSADVVLKINSENYMIGNDLLYEKYCQNKILCDNKLSGELFENLAKKFFEFVKTKDVSFISGSSYFRLYVLPSDDKIKYVKKESGQSTIKENDCFGNETISYPESPTKGVFFLSYDDKAFTVNCNKKQQFYKNLGIGKESFEKIFLPKNKSMHISGLDWYFVDLDNTITSFENKKAGIYAQLHNNYVKMKSHSSTERNDDLNITCIKRVQNKLEVILNENLSMQKMDTIFGNVETSDIPPFALESLQIKKEENVIYRYYVMALKSLLNQTPFDVALLLTVFVHKLRDELSSWLTAKTDKDPKEFFRRSEFCYKILNTSSISNNNMSELSNFAIRVGMMTRTYIDFRKTHNFTNNSLRDILSKPKYDIATLQFVVKQIGRGIHLLNMDEKKYDVILSSLSDCVPSSDVDIDSRQDLSYHFYMGYFGGTES